MEIRKFKDEDARSASALIEECFRSLDLGGHTEEGKRLQIEFNSPEDLIKRAQNVRYFVAVEDNRVIGIGGYDKYKVRTLFVDVGYQNQGIGKALLHKILSEAIKDGLLSIDTWATFYSERFYRALGFERIGEVHLPDDKSEIILIEMKKNLSQIKI